MALTADAELYILDEPLANLDATGRTTVMQEIWDRTSGKMLVMIMHGAGEYISSFDHVHVLGREVAADNEEYEKTI